MIVSRKINVQEYMPNESISPLVLIYKNGKEQIPFLLGGTGFFVYFPPYEEVYFVTANHCFKDKTDYFDNDKYVFAVPIDVKSGNSRIISFNQYQIAEEADILIWRVNKEDHTESEFLKIKNRAIRLLHQDDIDEVLQFHIKTNTQVRIFGFPTSCDHSSTRIESDGMIVAEPRSSFGTLKESNLLDDDSYEINGISWVSGSLGGFSGAPIIGFEPDFNVFKKSGEVKFFPVPLVLGVTLTGTDSSKKIRFISINIVTDLIAQSILESEQEKN